MSIPPPEVTLVDKHRVACDGAEAIRGGPGFVPSALGHPRVWLEMGEADFVECSYCDRRFELAHGSEGLESEQLAPGVYEGSHGH